MKEFNIGDLLINKKGENLIVIEKIKKEYLNGVTKIKYKAKCKDLGRDKYYIFTSKNKNIYDPNENISIDERCLKSPLSKEILNSILLDDTHRPKDFDLRKKNYNEYLTTLKASYLSSKISNIEYNFLRLILNKYYNNSIYNFRESRLL